MDEAMGVHWEQGKKELLTCSVVVTGHFLTGGKMCSELQTQLRVISVSYFVMPEYFVI